MSTTIDERVVEMRFDNKQFESGVQTSLSTLDKLKKGLNLEGAAKGLESLGDAAKKCTLSTLSNSVETVRTKFSALEVMAMTALSNITNSAINAGKRIISQFTVEPITTGFNEYELKMGSIQTIMASTGESLDRVNQKLDELNTYSDKTIYSFSDMTSNIGKFTNAGVKLDDAVAAIQGVSNVAAVSGANANEASRAMYNFAQALSAGYVKLIDWKSIENANMATVEFKNQLLETALALGTVVKEGDMYKTVTTDANGKVSDLFNATRGFNDALSNQWMTTEVLTTTLAKYADETTEIGKKAFAAAQDVKTFTQLMDTLKESAQSGWAETWQLFVGDFEEAKKTLSEFNNFFGDMIGKSADARNALFAGALSSGWSQLTKQVGKAGLSVDEFQAALKDVGRESRADFDQMMEDCGGFEESLSQGWLTTEMVTKALDKMAESADGTVKYTDEQIELLRTLYTEANTSSGAVANLVQNMTRQSGRELIFDSLLNTCKAVQKVFQTLKGAWQEVFPSATSEQLYSIITALHKFSERLIISDETADKIRRTFKGLFSALDIIKQAFSALFNAVKPLLGGLSSLSGGLLDSAASFGDWLVALDEGIKKGDVFNKAVQKISNFVSTAIAKIREFIAAIKEKFDFPGFELFHSLLQRVQERIAQFVRSITGMKTDVGGAVNAMGITLTNSKFLTALMTLFDGVKSVGKGILNAVKKLVNGIVGAFKGSDFSGAIDLLNGISFAVIADGISKFMNKEKSDGGIAGLFKGLFDSIKSVPEGIKGLLGTVKTSLETWQQDIKSGVLLKIAGAIAILAASLIALSLVDSDKLNTSLGAMTVTFIELIGAMTLFSKIEGNSKAMGKNAASMIKMSAAILLLAIALRSISSLDGGQLAKGLIGIAGLMAGLVASFKILGSGSGTVVKGSTQMLIFAAAIKVLASVCKDLAALSWEQMAKGLVGVGVLLAEVDVFLKTAKFSGKGLSTATGIVILSSAIKILASACKDFAKMSWSGITKGLASVGALLAEVAAFTKLTGNAKHVISTGLALIEIGAAMKIFVSAVSDFGNMSWEQIAKGLVAMAGALAEITIAVNLMPKKMTSIGVGLIAVGAALEIIANSLGKMGSMSWASIAKGLVTLGGAMAELAIGLNLMKGTLGGSAAMLVAAGALAVLTPILLTLGSMSWESIAKGLVTLAGAFTVIGVAGALLSPIIPAILGLSGAFALIGVSALGIGAGLVLVGAGLSATAVGIGALATALGGGVTVIVAGLTAIIAGIADLIPMLALKIGEAVVAFCQAISASAPALAEAVTMLVLMLVDVLVQCVPAIADGALALLVGVLKALVSYTPQIVDAIFQFLIGLIEGIARNIPDLVQAAVDLLMSFFAGIVSALSGIDTDTLLKGIVGIGLLSAIMAALAAVASLTPGAMVGVLGMGAVIAELALVLAAIGALAQIPGLSWLIGEGGQLLQGIGTAIGSFIGGIVGGFMSGVSSEFPQIGADLSAFMTNVQPFITGASSITPETFSGVKSLVEVIMLLTAADLLQGITSWLTGGSSLTDFANELVPFGTAMSKFSQSIAGMDANLVSQAAIAGKTLAEMADTIPNSGGVVGFFAGENDIDTFGKQLVKFGSSMAKFSDAVKGVDGDAVVSAANAGKAMAEMASTLPNSGGVVGFFAGENDMSAFGAQLIPFGIAIKDYSLAVKGLDVEAVNNSAVAGKAMAELANTLPNTGGAVSFFTGNNDLSTFGTQLLCFGTSIKAYSLAVSGMDTDAINNSATAGKALVELAKTVPNSGGLVSFFTGSNDLDSFGEQIIAFGGSMKAYADTIAGMDTEAVTASTIAAQSLAELQASLPNVGGVVSFFTGGNDLETFAEGLKPFGKGMKAYADSVAGMDAEAVTASTIAAQALSELQASLPNVGGVVDFFTGGNDLETFGAGLKPFGKGMKAYADSVTGINTEAVTASAIAAQSLSELQASLPNVGGVVDFFTGGNDLATFSAGLIPFGVSMKSYADAVSGINADSVAASAIAAKSLVELQSSLPNVGGVVSFFNGETDLAGFGKQLISFGKNLSDYSEAIEDVKPDAVTASANAASALSNLASGLPDSSLFDKWFGDDNSLASFGADVAEFGDYIGYYYSKVANADPVKLSGVITQIWALVDLAKGVKGIDKKSFSNFGSALKDLANTGVTNFTAQFENSDQSVTNSVRGLLNDVKIAVSSNLSLLTPAAISIVTTIGDGIKDNSATTVIRSVSSMMANVCTIIHSFSANVKSATSSVLTSAAGGISECKSSFEQAGRDVGQGFVNGINAMKSKASEAGKNLGTAALNSARKALDSHSPSRQFVAIGEDVGAGFEIGLKNSIPTAKKSTENMVQEVIGAGTDAVEDSSSATDDWIAKLTETKEVEVDSSEQTAEAAKESAAEKVTATETVAKAEKSAFEEFEDRIEEERYYNRITTQEQLEQYEDIRNSSKLTADEIKKADREIYSLRKQLMDESYQHSMDWIDDEKYYDRMSLADELAAYKRVQSRYAKGTDERKKMDREVYRLEKEIYEAQEQYVSDVQSVQSEANQKRLDLEQEYADKVVEINERLDRDIQALNDEYQNKLESRADSLYQAYGLFDEVKEREEVNGETLMNNLEGQVKEFSDWQDILGSLSARGLSSELIEELQEMGPSAISQLEALNSMSDDELDKYASLWSIKHAQAREQATSELEGLRIETQESIAQLRSDAERELDEYRAVWQENLAQVNADANAQLEQLRRDFEEKVGLIKKDTDEEMEKMAESAQKILTEAGWDETGQAIVTGLTEGVQSQRSSFVDELTSMALEAVEAVKDTLEINSPSRVFRELGSYTGIGFVEGLASYSDKSYTAGANVAESAKTGLATTIQAVANLVESGIDTEPTIRPVLDLTDISRGVGEIDSVFGGVRTLGLAGQASIAFASKEGNSPISVRVESREMIDELRSLRSDMSSMLDRMEKLRIYLDTGTLVGEIAGPLDSALGQISIHKRRGN